jgi:hypothetical protein
VTAGRCVGWLRAVDVVVYTSFPSADSVTVRDLFGVEGVLKGSTLGASAECTPRVHPYANSYGYRKAEQECVDLTTMAINSSKSKTGLLTVLQQDHDLRPSWKTYHLRWSSGDGLKWDTYRSAWVVDASLGGIVRKVKLLATTFMSAFQHDLVSL